MKFQLVVGMKSDPELYVYDDGKIEITEVQLVDYDVCLDITEEAENGGEIPPYLKKDHEEDWCYVTEVNIQDGKEFPWVK